MSQRAAHLQILRRAHRRLVVWRIVECAGLGALTGVAVGFVMLPMFFWQGRPAILASALLPMLGAILGGCFALIRRPSLLKTAMRIDRQFQLHDLLSTAIHPQTFLDPQFGRIIAAQADAACAGISGNDLIVRRLGARAWGGIGIAAAILMTIAMMGTTPPATTAHVAPPPALLQPPQLAAPRPAEAPDARSMPSTLSHEASSAAHAPLTDDEASADPSRFSEPSSPNHNGLPGGASDGAGGASGRTQASRLPDSAGPHATAPQDSDISSGTIQAPGAAASSTASGVGSPDHPTAAPAAPLIAEPWRSATWSADRSEAQRRLEAQQLLDTYRDTVGAYFDRRGQ